MGNGKETDKVSDQPEKAPEKGTTATKELAADSQSAAVDKVKQQRLEEMARFLKEDTMGGLAGGRAKEGNKFEITGLNKYDDARAKRISELYDNDIQQGWKKLVQEVDQGTKAPEAPATAPEEAPKTPEAKKEAPPKPPEAREEPPKERVEHPKPKPEARKESADKVEAPPKNVEYNDAGKPAQVTYPDGSSRQFAYNEKGEVTGMYYNDKNGEPYDYWEYNQKTQKWDQYKPTEEKPGEFTYNPTGESFDGKVSVDAKSGDLTYEPNLPVDEEGIPDYPHSPTKVVEKADGTKVESWYPAPYTHDVVKDSNDRVTEMRAANGDSMKFEYDDKGKIQQVYDKNGKPMLDGSEKSVEINESSGALKIDKGDGETETHYAGGATEYHYSDGSSRVEDQSGAVYQYDKNNHLTDVWTDQERHFAATTDKDGKEQAEYTVRPGDSLSKIAEDVLRHRMLFAGEGKGEIPKDILKRIAEDIAKANGIKDPDKISAGQKITIPPDVWKM